MRSTFTILLASLLLSSSAQAASSTLGQLPSETKAACPISETYLQTQSAGPATYTVPAHGGIITSWSETPLGAGSERLVVARPTGSGQYTVVGVSPVETLSGSSTQTFNVHIAVKAGDILGLDVVSGSFSCEFTGSSGDALDTIPGIAEEGAVLTPQPEHEEHSERLNVTATLEPDADHDGYADLTEDACPTDPSTHLACPLPVITGIPSVGQTLTANPEGSPENPVYAWLRCNAPGANCYAVPGATGFTYTISSLDIGHTLRFRKSASNEEDTQVTESSPTALVAFATTAAVTPQLSSFTQTASKWREGAVLARYARAKARSTKTKTPPTGTTFGFALNLPANVTLTFTEKATGRSVSGKCQAITKHNEHKHACTRTVTVGELHDSAHLGKSSITFQGRLSATQKLSPGRYTVTITAGSAGRSSAPKSLSFTILAS